MKTGALAKGLGATAAASPAVVTPSAIAVANHNQKVSAVQKLEGAEEENQKLVQEKMDMEEDRKKLQAQEAKESFQYKQQIQNLQKQLKEDELEKESLKNKLKETDQYNDKLKACLALFARLPYDDYLQDREVFWCANEMQEQDLSDLKSYWQYRQSQSQSQYYPPLH